jgi:hypothetical protein
MNVLRTKRAAAVGMAGALALGTVVSAGVMSPADAAAAATPYTCTLTAPIGDQTMTVSGSLSLPSSVQSGQNLANRAVTMGVNMDPTLVGTLATALAGVFGSAPTAIGGSASDVAFPVAGSSALPVGKITIPQTTPTASGLALTGTGKTAAHRAPLPGDYVVSMPKDFTFNAVGTFTGVGDAALGDVPCHTDSPATLGTMHVVKATSRTTATLAAPSRTSRATKVIAKVRAAGYAAKGTVIAKLGTKTVDSATLRSGKATLNLGKLKAGKHTVKVFYKATKANKASSDSLAFTTKRG